MQAFVKEGEEDLYNGVFSLENDTPHVSFPTKFDEFLNKFTDKDAMLKVKTSTNVRDYSCRNRENSKLLLMSLIRQTISLKANHSQSSY